MKISRIITRGLASGELRMRPEVMGVIKKLSDCELHNTSEASPEDSAPKPPAPKQPLPAPPSLRGSQQRMAGASSWPVRWIRWSCMALSCATLGLVHPVRAAERPSAFDTANQAFAEGRMAEATRGYEGVLAKQGYSAPVLFNLANAQLRDGKTGAAILNYERARWLAPNDPDIAANLRLALERANLPVVAPAWPLHYAQWFTLNGWAGLAVASLLLFTATLPLVLLLPGARPVLRFARIAAVVAVVASVAAVSARWSELDRAVVTAKEAVVRVSPFTVGQALFKLPEGSLVNIVRPHGGFALVRSSDGHQGWISRDVLSPVVSNAH